MSASFENSTQRDLRTMIDCMLVSADADALVRVDPICPDHHFATIDRLLGGQIDTILRHPAIQTLESAWRGLQFPVNRAEFRRNVNPAFAQMIAARICQICLPASIPEAELELHAVQPS